MTCQLNLKTFSLSVIALLLILASGCTKQEMRIDKSKTDCPFDTTKLVDKDWYIFSPVAHASAYRNRFSSEGDWFGPGATRCGIYTWSGCSTFSILNIYDYENVKFSVLELEDTYLKAKVLEHSENNSYVGMIFEFDNVPH